MYTGLQQYSPSRKPCPAHVADPVLVGLCHKAVDKCVLAVILTNFTNDQGVFLRDWPNLFFIARSSDAAPEVL